MGQISVQKILHYAGVSGIEGSTMTITWNNPNPVGVYAISLDVSELGGGNDKHVEVSGPRFRRNGSARSIRWTVTNHTDNITYYHVHMSFAWP